MITQAMTIAIRSRQPVRAMLSCAMGRDRRRLFLNREEDEERDENENAEKGQKPPHAAPSKESASIVMRQCQMSKLS